MSRYIKPLTSSAKAFAQQVAQKKARDSAERARALRDSLQFFHNLGESADVKLEPGYNQDEVFDDQFERRAREIQRTPNGSSALSIVPQKQGPWSGNGQLGFERPFAPDIDNRQTILKLDEWGFPERWTITLGSTYDMPTDSNEYKWSARAEVTAGSGGAFQQFDVDWMEGTSFSVTANAVLVNAVFNEFTPNEIPVNLRLRATICRGTIAGPSLPTITEIVTAAAGNTGNMIRIPAFARYVSLLNQVKTSLLFDPLCFLEFYPTDAGITFPIAVVSGAQVLAMGNRVPIPALARAIVIDNGTAAAASGKVIFAIET